MKIYSDRELHRMPHKDLQRAYRELANQVSTEEERHNLNELNRREDPFNQLSTIDRLNLWFSGKGYYKR